MKPPREARVGVLFVHGIGQQTPGETLIDFGEPLAGWVRRWLEGRSDGEFQILKSALSEPVRESGEPAHLLFQYTLTASEPPVQHRWLLAESCWATEFRNPPFGRLAAWMVGVGAWMVLSHFGKSLRLHFAGWKRWALGLPLLLLAVALALAVQLLVAVLGLVALIPIPRLRRALSGLLLTLTGTLGDSYVLLSSPVQEAAAVSRLRRDLAWLSDRVEKVFVVAHSQGAAVAHRALKGLRPENVCRLITFGSGIGKLEELRLLGRPKNRDFYLAVQFGLPLGVLSILLLPRAVATLQGPYLLLGLNLYFLLVLLAPVLLLAWILATTWSGWRAYLDHVREDLPLPPGLEWRDFYATADPVPNGPLTGEPAGLPGLQGREIVNLSSAVADHSAYWANQDEFVTGVVREIDSAAGTGLIHPYEENHVLSKVPGARRRRVRILLAMRAAAVAGTALALFGLRHQLRSLAEKLVWNRLAEWGDTGLLGSVAETLASGFGAVARLVTGASAETLRAWGLASLGALLLGLAIAICYLVAARAWSWWDGFAIDDLFTRRNTGWSTYAAAAVAVLLGATPLIFGGAALATRDLGASLAVVAVAFRWYFNALALVVLLFFGFLMTVALLPSWWELRTWARQAKQKKGRVAAVAAAVLIGIPLLTFSVAALVTRDLQRSWDIVLATSLRLAAVALLPIGIFLLSVALNFIWSVWDKLR